MNFPNFLTIIRLFLIPVFVLIFFSNMNNSLTYSIMIFALAGITDVVDGYIARKYNLITKLGIVLDPLADKLMLITVLTCLVISNYIPLWVLVIVSTKEFIMISAGILLYNRDTVVPSNIFGKSATSMFYLAIFTLAFEIPGSLYIMYLAVLSTLIAFIIYFKNYLSNKKTSNF